MTQGSAQVPLPTERSVSPVLRPAAEVHDAALRILETERARLRPLLPDAELVLSGGSSIPAALTRGDVDLHLRVPVANYPRALDVLRGLYAVRRPEIWSDTLATFEVEAALPTGLAATPIGSEHDRRFTRSWQLLATEPRLLDAYNSLKRRHAKGDAATYEAAKSTFFSELMDR